MARRSSDLPNLGTLPNLCPTFARPRASRRAGLPDLPTFSADRAYMVHPAFSTHAINRKRSGRLGRLGNWRNGAACGCPTSCLTSEGRAVARESSRGARPAVPFRFNCQDRLFRLFSFGSSWSLPVTGNSDRGFSLVTRGFKGGCSGD